MNININNLQLGVWLELICLDLPPLVRRINPPLAFHLHVSEPTPLPMTIGAQVTMHLNLPELEAHLDESRCRRPSMVCHWLTAGDSSSLATAGWRSWTWSSFFFLALLRKTLVASMWPVASPIVVSQWSANLLHMWHRKWSFPLSGEASTKLVEEVRGF